MLGAMSTPGIGKRFPIHPPFHPLCPSHKPAFRYSEIVVPPGALMVTQNTSMLADIRNKELGIGVPGTSSE